MAYAQYLDADFHVWCNKAVHTRLEEDKNPEKGVSRTLDAYVKRYKKEGRDDTWILERLEGIDYRKKFVSTAMKCGATTGGISPILGRATVGRVGQVLGKRWVT